MLETEQAPEIMSGVPPKGLLEDEEPGQQGTGRGTRSMKRPSGPNLKGYRKPSKEFKAGEGFGLLLKTQWSLAHTFSMHELVHPPPAGTQASEETELKALLTGRSCADRASAFT